VTYTYDGDGRPVKKSNGMLYWAGSSSDALVETDLSGNATAEYVFFIGRRIARIDHPSGSINYYYSDHLGSADVITNASGTITKESDYYPYGGEIPVTTGDSNRYKFTGKERDSESGLDNFGARYDSSSLGRFMTPDWAARPTAVPYAVFGDPQSLNLYGYVRNDPVSRADLDGHAAEADAFINRGDSSMFGYGFWGMGVLASGIPSLSNTQAAEVKAQQKVLADAQKQSQQPNQQQTKCSAQARAKIVGIDGHGVKATLERALMHIFHVEHMFWTVKGSDGIEKDLSGGPTKGTGGKLGEWSRNTDAPADADHGKEADYRDSGKVIWNAPQSGDLCGRVDAMEHAVDSWKADSTYNFFSGPNSNSAFNAVGAAGRMPQQSPFWTPGANTPVPQ
jgi:RHS repeat-associated protein